MMQCYDIPFHSRAHHNDEAVPRSHDGTDTPSGSDLSNTLKSTARQEHNTVNAAHYIPFPRNRYFVGRNAELAEMTQKLVVDQDCQKMSIVGLGGTGKSQVALQFVYLIKDTRPDFSIFWLPAMSLESFELACREAVNTLRALNKIAPGDDGDAKELVKRYLNQAGAGEKWLLVVDNADDHDVIFGKEGSKGIIDYLPSSEQGMTVYTTRTHEIAELLTRADTLELGAMSHQDATDFLRKSLVKKHLLDDVNATAELLGELTYLPLAIRQATAYMNMSRMLSFASYLRLLRRTEKDLIGLMSKEFFDDTRYKGSANAVATTWLVSFNKIRERNKAAVELLIFMSCIEWKAIPHSLLPRKLLVEHSQKNLQKHVKMENEEKDLSDEEWVDLSNTKPKAILEEQKDLCPEERLEEHSEEQIEEAIGILCAYSFLSRRQDKTQDHEKGEEQWYDMHRLVHLAARIWISKHGSLPKRIDAALQHVVLYFPRNGDWATRARWRSFLPHVLRILKSPGSQQDGQAYSRLRLRVGSCFQVEGRFQDAFAQMEECYRVRKDMFPEDHNDRLLAQHELAIAYKTLGQFKQAITLLEQVVALKENALDEDIQKLASQHALSTAYRGDGQTKRGLELLEHVVEIKGKFLESNNASFLASQHELASACYEDRQFIKAIALLEQIVYFRQHNLRDDDPLRLSSQHGLAMAYLADGQIRKAVSILEHVVETEANVLASDHPSRLASQHELARAYYEDGQREKAVTLLDDVAEVQARAFKHDHPKRIASEELLQRFRREMLAGSHPA